ncbi:uncharacterized protein K452DRAFT_297808 [Aplosporella prunicola CBS 121167]|uniref:DNA/RNA-binding protein Alba-like domain-containing protein n=1 Tax=Aplosporella prunicola CBS 121167 TaxID=1176127 RepID=A0A6A6BEG3_9PEZI|nr:uncharacterized protein K452DRAFT_297808 [Aplosporella prunicola CBS 121167]KAF2142540.1 hypothetical protein K452DRAFT_297808 [Aplosporella prunicola CBS 121167]
MAKKNKLPTPSAAAASNKRRRIAAPPPDPPVATSTSASAAAAAADKPTTTTDNNNVAGTSTNTSTGTSSNNPLSDAIIHFAPGSKVQQKVRSVLAALNTNPTTATNNNNNNNTGAVKTPPPLPPSSSYPGVAHLEARAPAANKLVTVLEIAKRQLEAEGRAWWSYAGVRGELTVVDRAPKAKAKPTEGEKESESARKGEVGDKAEARVEEDDDDDEDAFEPLGKRALLPEKKVRSVAVMVAYLATQPVPALKALYGEQCGGA